MRTIERRWRLRHENRLVTAKHEPTAPLSEIYPVLSFILARTGQTSEHWPIGHTCPHKLWFDKRHAWCEKCQAPWPCPPIREEATRFDDHPDYREEWRP